MLQKSRIWTYMILFGLFSSPLFFLALGQDQGRDTRLQISAPNRSASDPKIFLESDGELDVFCAGNGTDGLSVETAHILQDFQINAGSSGSAIYFSNITRFVIIQNCTLIGSGTSDLSSDAGISLRNCSNILIQNCSIRNNNRNGIDIDLCDSIGIENSHVYDNLKIGVYFYASNHSEIIESNISDNGWEGVYLTWDCHFTTIVNCILSSNRNGIYAYKGITHVSIFGNSIEDNENNGIYGELSTDFVVENNFIAGVTHDFGIYLELTSHNVLFNNTVEDVQQRGITLYETNSSRVEKNTILRCGYGLEIWGGESGNYNILQANIFANCSDYGIILDDTCEHNQILFNEITDSGSIGLYLTDSIFNTSIQYNTILRNGGYGMLMDRDSNNNAIFFNEISKNADCGMHLEDVYNTSVENNYVEENYAGFDANQLSNMTIFGNVFHNNTFEGVYISDSLENFIVGNNCTQNNIGLQLENSENNTVWMNYFANNTQLNGRDSSGDNWWDNGTVGNYWSDFLDRYPFAMPIGNVWDSEYEVNASGIDETNVNDTKPLVSVLSDLTVDSQGNVIYGYGHTGNTIAWNILGGNQISQRYWIFTDENTLVQSGMWGSEVQVEFNVDGLPVGTHEFTLIATDGTAWGMDEDTIRVMVGLVPDQAVFITTSQTISINNITLSWDEVANADAYNVYMNDNFVINTEATELWVNFTVNGTYVFYIVAENQFGDSLPSEEITITVELSGENGDDTDDSGTVGTWIYFVAGGGMVIVVATGVFIFLKKKKK